MNPKIIEIGKLKFQLKVKSPFITCMHHKDQFPKGKGNMEPESYIKNRDRGSDFNENAPWRMYHGDKIPGFPVHPHRGFETVTVVLEGFVDHADGLGAAGRYGMGDVQWMTAGEGLQHAEMFPLLDENKDNPMELFQIWLNLAKKDKFVKPYYKMLWNEQIPVMEEKDRNGRSTFIRMMAGSYKEIMSPEPNPDSWAADRNHHVGIWIITMEPHAEFTLPAVSTTLNRMIYYYTGEGMMIEDTDIPAMSYAELQGNEEILFKNKGTEGRLLLLEGEPINEPVTSYGPFVMNTEQEIIKAYEDYQKTRFGGWPWEREDPVHPKESGRFAKYADGSIEKP